jgi:hypothetical protein
LAGCCRLGSDLQPISEFHTQDHSWQLVATVEAAPGALRGLDQLEDHGERGLVGKAAFAANGAVAHGRERANRARIDGYLRAAVCGQIAARLA